MLSYGFIMENNDHNTYWLQIGIHQNDPFRQEKIRLLRSKKLGYDISMISIYSKVLIALF
jgi:hypothetical protein